MSLTTGITGALAYFSHTRGDYDRAKILYQKAMDDGMDNPKYISAYGVLALKEGQPQIAIDLFVKALRCHPKPKERINIRISRAIAFMKIGDFNSARVALEDMHQKNESQRIYETLGYLYVVTGDDEKAIAYNEKAINYAPFSIVVLDNIAQFYINKNRFDLAKPFLEEAYELNQKKVDVNYHLAQVAEQEKDYDAAYLFADKAKKCEITALNDVTVDELDQLIQRVVVNVDDPSKLLLDNEEAEDKAKAEENKKSVEANKKK